VFSTLFLFVWLTFLLLGIAYLLTPDVAGGAPDIRCQKAGGVTGLIASFLAWWVALAGVADDANR